MSGEATTPAWRPDGRVETAHDVCAPTLAQRVAAVLDKDTVFREGDALPRGWHVALFTVSTPQSALRPDGVGGLGFAMPELGLPRLMLGGKRTRFDGELLIGSRVRRESRIASVAPKSGRSGRMAIVTVRHEIFGEDRETPRIVEEQDYIMREAATAASAPGAPAPPVRERIDAPLKTIVPSEIMLFRYCAVTFNAHRIHYDRPYATGTEGYPGLVVNGGLPGLFLIELFKEISGRQPDVFDIRNVGPLYCGEPCHLRASETGDVWSLTAENDAGEPAAQATAR
jgi:3-methylfumaryl-CoA hydratase